MSLFDVIFNRVERVSSDAAVQTNPTQTSTIVQPLHQANIAQVEADSAEDAEAAVRVAYNGITDEVSVHEVKEPVVETPAVVEPTVTPETPVAETETPVVEAPVVAVPPATEPATVEPASEAPPA